MDMRQLRYYVQIVESGSLAKASRQLFIAQPALSHQMARLEDEIGRALLVRSSRGVVPTDNGVALYHHAKFLLRQMEETIAVARQDLTALGGRVSIGMGPTTAAQLGLPLMEHIASRLPGVRLNVVEGSSGQIETMIRSGQLDLAVLFSATAASDLPVTPLAEEELFVMLPADSDLVAPERESITLAEVAQLPLLLPSLRHTTRHRRIELEFERAGLPLDPVAEIDSLPLLMRWVERRKGVTIQPSASVHVLGDPARWRCLRIADAPVVRMNYLYTLPASKLSPSCAAVRDELHALVRALVERNEWRGVVVPAAAQAPASPHEALAAS